MRLPLSLAALLLASGGVCAEAQVTPMPELRGLAGPDATACARGEAVSCVHLADTRLRAGDGARANALYRRAADLARETRRVPARRPVTGPVHSVEQAVAVLELNWDTTIVRAAALRGSGDLARTARAQLFGEAAVARWTGRPARVADAFAAVHTMTLREDGVFAGNAWIGDLGILASDGPCWEIRFGTMLLDFIAYVDASGRVLALVHPPEG